MTKLNIFTLVCSLISVAMSLLAMRTIRRTERFNAEYEDIRQGRDVFREWLENADENHNDNDDEKDVDQTH